MKLELAEITQEETIDFQKNEIDFLSKNTSNEHKKFMKKIFLHTLSRSFLIVGGISCTSLFFLLNNVAFEQQINFVKNPAFSSSALMVYALYLVYNIIYNMMKIDNKNNFFSIWEPIKVFFLASFFIPTTMGLSFFADLSIKVVKILTHFF